MKFTRGDTYMFKFQRKDDNDKIIKSIADKMMFTVKKNHNTENILFQKSLADGTIRFTSDGYYHIEIEPKDTQNLRYGNYVCDIEVEQAGKVTTIYLDKITLGKEVTF